MALHVKDVETDVLVRQLAESRGIGLTEAIKEAVREALEADDARAARYKLDDLEERLKPVFSRLDKLPRPKEPIGKAFFDGLWGEQAD